MALIWATGKTWLRVPETIRIQVDGRFSPGIDAKDLALKLCRVMTTSGATYAALGYHSLEWLTLPGRQTLSSIAIELGAKAGIFLADDGSWPGDVPDLLYLDPEGFCPYCHCQPRRSGNTGRSTSCG